MRILLTRARDEAMRTAEKLNAAGHQALLSPVLQMAPTGAQWPDGVTDAVLATSAQAFDLADFALEWPLPEVRRLVPLFVVGRRTETAARRRGFAGEVRVAADAKDLASDVVATMRPPARLLYLAGHDRKSDLETRCKEAGLNIIAVEIYQACAAEQLSEEAIAAIAESAIDAVFHYSRRSAEIFLELAQKAGVNLHHLQHMAISGDAAAPLQAAGLPFIAIAAQPNEQAMLALLSGETRPATAHEM